MPITILMHCVEREGVFLRHIYRYDFPWRIREWANHYLIAFPTSYL